jgi:hypothetical protein
MKSFPRPGGLSARCVSAGVFGLPAALLVLPMAGYAASCTTQAELLALDRDALVAAGGRLSMAVLQQDDFARCRRRCCRPRRRVGRDSRYRGAGRAAGEGRQVQLRNLYLLDATMLTAPADTQFFCSNATGSLTVTINMRALPPGRYAVVLADAAGAPRWAGRWVGLAWDGAGATAGWKLAGLSCGPGPSAGTTASGTGRGRANWPRRISRGVPGTAMIWRGTCWCRWISLVAESGEAGQEQAQVIKRREIRRRMRFLYSSAGDRTWKIDSVRLDASLHQADLGVTYESTGVTDPAAQRTEAVAVLSALLKAQPGLRENFHGLWAICGKRWQADAGDGTADGADTVETVVRY